MRSSDWRRSRATAASARSFIVRPIVPGIVLRERTAVARKPTMPRLTAPYRSHGWCGAAAVLMAGDDSGEASAASAAAGTGSTGVAAAPGSASAQACDAATARSTAPVVGCGAAARTRLSRFSMARARRQGCCGHGGLGRRTATSIRSMLASTSSCMIAAAGRVRCRWSSAVLPPSIWARGLTRLTWGNLLTDDPRDRRSSHDVARSHVLLQHLLWARAQGILETAGGCQCCRYTRTYRHPCVSAQRQHSRAAAAPAPHVIVGTSLTTANHKNLSKCNTREKRCSSAYTLSLARLDGATPVVARSALYSCIPHPAASARRAAFAFARSSHGPATCSAYTRAG